MSRKFVIATTTIVAIIGMVTGSRMLLDEPTQDNPTTTTSAPNYDVPPIYMPYEYGKSANKRPPIYIPYEYGKSANKRPLKSANHKSQNQPQPPPQPENTIPASAEYNRGNQGYFAYSGGYNANQRQQGGSVRGNYRNRDYRNEGRFDDRGAGNYYANGNGYYSNTGGIKSGDRAGKVGRRGYRGDNGYAATAGNGYQKSRGRKSAGRKKNGYENYNYEYDAGYVGGYAANYGNRGWDRKSRDRRQNNGNNNYRSGAGYGYGANRPNGQRSRDRKRN